MVKQQRVMDSLREETIMGLRNLEASSMASRVVSTVHMMRATPKDKWDTSMQNRLIRSTFHANRYFHSGGETGQESRAYGNPSDVSQQYPQHGAYGQQQHDPNQPPLQQGYQDPNAPQYDPNAPVDPNAPEGERGLMGALAGGAGGYFLGHKANHGILGMLGGAFAGSKAEDKFKEHHHHEGSQQGGGGSSWGGKW